MGVGFAERDRLQDLERRAALLEDVVARLPITLPTSSITEATGGGSSGGGTLSARLTEDKLNTATNANAELVDASGVRLVLPAIDEEVADEAARLALTEGASANDSDGLIPVNGHCKQVDVDRMFKYLGGGISDPDNWEDVGPGSVDIKVVDNTVQSGTEPSGKTGYEDYIGAHDGSSQPGFLCEVEYLGISDYNGSGKPGYKILEMEGLAVGVGATLAENGHPSKTVYNVTVTGFIIGSNQCCRVPKQGMTVSDPDGYLQDKKVGDDFLAWRDHGDSVYRAGPPDVTDPPVIVRFELTADLALAGTSAAAIILNDDGSTPVSPEAITVTDANGHFSGYGPYVDAEDQNQPGFRGTAIRYVISGPEFRYYIVDIERLYPTILVELNADVGTDTGPFETDFLKGYGNNYRPPRRISSGVMNTYNTDRVADDLKSGEKAYANYDPGADRYELEKIGDGGEEGERVGLAVIVEEDPGVAAAINTIDINMEGIAFGTLHLGGKENTPDSLPPESGALGIKLVRKYPAEPDPTVTGWDHIYEPAEPQDDVNNQVILHTFVPTDTARGKVVAYMRMDDKNMIIAEDCS